MRDIFLAMQGRSLVAFFSTFYRTLQQALFVRAIATAFVFADKARKQVVIDGKTYDHMRVM